MKTTANRTDKWPEPPKNPPLDGIELAVMTMDIIDKVLEIENASFSAPWSREAFDYDLNQNELAHYWVLLKDGEIIGYIGIWLVGNIAHITNICIDKKWRGCGLGRWFLLTTMKMGKDLGAERFTLEVRETNEAAIRLYESVGYKIVGKRENYYEEIGEDAYVMWTGKPPYDA